MSDTWPDSFRAVVAINEPYFREIFVMISRHGDVLPPGFSVVCLAADEAGEVLDHPPVTDASLVAVMINNLWFDVAPAQTEDPHLWLIRKLRARGRAFCS